MKRTQKRKIAILLPSLCFGGGERVSLSLAEAMSELGVEVEFVLTVREGELLAEAEQRFRVVDLDCRRAWQIPLRLAMYAFRKRPDVIISNYWKTNLCACVSWLLYPWFKLVVTEHSPPTRTPLFAPTSLYTVTTSVLYRVAHRIVAVSGGVADDMAACSYGLSKKIAVVYNAIKASPCDSSGERRSSRSKKTVITVGRLTAQKNQALLLEAFRLLVRSVEAELLILGEGELRGMLEAKAVELGIGERVKFLGYQPRPSEFLAQADLFVLSSDYEGLPTVIIEALYSGLPVVSTDCPHGPREILMSGEYGALVKVGDGEEFAAAMARELSGPERDRKRQRQRAERFAPSRVAEEYLALLGMR